MLFKIQKTESHWNELRRSKSFIADDFFPPVALMNGNLKDLFENNQAWKSDPETEEYKMWRDAVVECAGKLNFDAIIELAYFMAFEANLSDKQIWVSIENAALENLHFYELKHLC
jgi:hypothetical protein